MSTGRRKFTAEFKAEAVKLAASGGVSSTARDLGLGLSTLTKWIAASKQRAGVAPAGEETNVFKLQEEVRQLRAENRRLQTERDILKKATAFFANENK